MKQVGPGGFTIIETTLFLAIASFMLLIAMNSISGRNRLIQFTDSVRGLEAQLEKKQSEIRSGVTPSTNCRWDGSTYDFTNPGNGTCLFLGYIFEIGDFKQPAGTPDRSEITFHQVVGTRVTSRQLQNCADSGISALACANPAVSPVSEVYELPWGSEIFGGDYDSQESYGFALVREPSSTSVEAIVFRDLNLSNPDLLNETANPPDTVFDPSETANYCVMSADSELGAAITFGNAFREEAFQSSFEDLDGFPSVCGSGGSYDVYR